MSSGVLEGASPQSKTGRSKSAGSSLTSGRIDLRTRELRRPLRGGFAWGRVPGIVPPEWSRSGCRLPRREGGVNGSDAEAMSTEDSGARHSDTVEQALTTQFKHHTSYTNRYSENALG